MVSQCTNNSLKTLACVAHIDHAKNRNGKMKTIQQEMNRFADETCCLLNQPVLMQLLYSSYIAVEHHKVAPLPAYED